MPIIAKSSGGERNPVAPGVHIATCIKVIDLGMQYSQAFNVTQRKVMLTWEVHGDTIIVDGEEKPKLISKEYTLSLGERAKLRAHLDAWRGRAFTEQELMGFDLKNVLGCACQLQVMHNEKGYDSVNAVLAMPKGMTAPQQVHDSVYFDLSEKSSLSMLSTLPRWMQEKIMLSPEYRELSGESNYVSHDEEMPPYNDGFPF